MFGEDIKKILACREAVDMRKSFDGLIGVIQSMDKDPLSGTLYVFINKRGNYLKSIFWDRTGYCLFAKLRNTGAQIAHTIASIGLSYLVNIAPMDDIPH